ncbi:hypothetical protein H6F77_07875 [Microcoleus sp. FACHB-831]|jgi:hypothetical protein|uniref:hypothetical protein n=1 Tax=Microcoleus sp. FACHB-831 TaxID=2692827 RepID=UPI0016841978|nr:hypothetical protein [Microcoleus sp. FACHB-831]MBD1921005.1 hypothetical protein [Microcoleus sp. FACHB-831]
MLKVVGSFLAGLWDIWHDTFKTVLSCSMNFLEALWDIWHDSDREKLAQQYG